MGKGKRGDGLTLLVCNGTVVVNQVMHRGHELGIAADTGEVVLSAACGGDASCYRGLLEMVWLESWCFGETRTFKT